MSIRKSPQQTPGMLAANRRNASKSTGPQTPEGKVRASQNSFRHGFYATPDAEVREEMIQIGEDPDLLGRLEKEFTAAWEPEDAMQASIVADIARLYLKKSLLERTMRAIRRKERRNDIAALNNCVLAPEREEFPIDEDELAEKGYMRMEPSRTAFGECRRILNEMSARVERRDLSDGLDELLALLYGANPTGIGKTIIDSFNILVETADAPEPKITELNWHALRSHINNELSAVLIEKESFLNKKREEFLAGVGSEWLPGTVNWGLMLDQEAKIDRLIDRKSRLLLRLQSLRRGPARRAAYQENDDLAIDAAIAEEVEECEWRGEESESEKLEVNGQKQQDGHPVAADSGELEPGPEPAENVQSNVFEERSRNVV